MKLVYFKHSSYTAIDEQGNMVKWEDIPLEMRAAAMALPAPPQQPITIAWNPVRKPKQ